MSDELEKITDNYNSLRMVIFVMAIIIISLFIIMADMAGNNIQDRKNVKRMENKHDALLKKMGIYDEDDKYNIMR